ncbi:MAG TPA: phosphoribosylglycinamide formyltransferase [Gemmatimonadales bacterium]|nr:phosphoribosylglycinamide formyltransferase [Gemmatimonadales bacterium]
MPMRVAVCISGRGSNLRALLAALGPAAPAQVVLIISSSAEAGGLVLAREAGIPSVVLAGQRGTSAMHQTLNDHRIDLVVLAGYLKQIPADVVESYRDRIINVHPALLPDFGGQGMYGIHVHRAVLASGKRESGATVHLVDEEYDRGRILAQERVPVLPGDTPELLAARVLEVEHRLLPAVVLAAAREGHPVPIGPSTR